MASAIVEGSHIQDDLADYYVDRFASGEIGWGETLSGGLSGALTNGVITVADGLANAINLDIPDHWNEAATYAVANFGESAYRFVADGISTGWDYVKSGFDTGWSAVRACSAERVKRDACKRERASHRFGRDARRH